MYQLKETVQLNLWAHLGCLQSVTESGHLHSTKVWGSGAGLGRRLWWTDSKRARREVSPHCPRNRAAKHAAGGQRDRERHRDGEMEETGRQRDRGTFKQLIHPAPRSEFPLTPVSMGKPLLS